MISLQLEGYDADENLIIKSSRVDNLYFEPSVCGEEVGGSSEKNLVSDIAANTLSRHTHENKDIIDKLSEDNGTLTYNGKTIGGSGERPTATCSFSFADSVLIPDISTIQEVLTVISYDEIEDIPVGTEIKTIEFLYNGEWIDIHRMFELDDIPYVLNMNRDYYSETYQVYFYAIVTFAGNHNINTISDAVQGYGITETRITYYTDKFYGGNKYDSNRKSKENR